MRRNIIILCGAALVLISSIWMPVIAFSQKSSWTNGQTQISLKESSSILFIVIILLVVLIKWKWRGIIWIILSIVGSVWSIFAAYTLYDTGLNILLAIDPAATRGPLTFTSGLYIKLAGYAIIIAGSVWDVVQKKKQASSYHTTNLPVQSNASQQLGTSITQDNNLKSHGNLRRG